MPTNSANALCGALLCLLALAAAPVRAQSLTTNFTTTATANGLGTYTNVSLGKFDSNLGSLQSVTVTVNYAVLGGSFKLTAPDPLLDQVYDSAAGRITIRQATTNSLGFTQIGQNSYTVSTTPAPPVNIPGGGQDTFAVTPFLAITNVAQSISNSFWSAYQTPGGTGNLVFQVRNSPDITVTGGLYTLDATAFTAETSMTVTYTYAVPEPSTYALLALTGLGFAAYRWRHRRSCNTA